MRVVPPAQGPRLPTEFESRPLDSLEDEDYFDGLELTGEIVGWAARNVEVVESRLSRVRATGCDLRRLRLRDVVLEGCDLSGAILEEARFTRVGFADCRLSGTVLSRSTLQDVSFRDCRMDQVSLRMSTGVSLRLRGCDLRNADFASVDMPASELLDCDLSGADVSNAALGGSALHRSRLDGMSGVLALRNVVVDAEQAFVLGNALLAAHGITVTDKPNPDV